MLAQIIRIHNIKLKYSEIASSMSPELTGNAIRCRIKGLRKAGRESDGAGVGGDINFNSSFLRDAGENGGGGVESDLNGDKDEGEWHGFDQQTAPPEAPGSAPSLSPSTKKTGMKVNKSSLPKPKPRNKRNSKWKKAAVLKKA